MSKFQVLCVTMHQNDFSKIEEMNIRSDVVFANQADRTEFAEIEFNGYHAKMVTTATRGVGKNRNIALLYADAEICLFADDDMVYAEGYAEAIKKAFEELPQADVIVFETDFEKQGEIYFRRRHRKGKLKWHKSWKYGTYAIAAKKESIDKNNIWFHTQFGGGCKYSSGEDSLFLNDCYKNKLRVYTYPFVLGKCKKDTSTWFEGFNEKYFFDKGVWLACAMPRMCKVIAPLLAIKWRKLSDEFGVVSMLRCIGNGIMHYKRGSK